LFGIWLYTGISKPLSHCIQDINQIADGNLHIQVVVDRNDEIGKLLEATKRMSENLRQIIGDVRSAADLIASESADLNANSDQMATGAEEVAAQAGTVATASEEMAATSSDIAHNCTMAADSSRSANETVLKGTEVVNESLEVMKRIAERVNASAASVEELGARSDHIGEIIVTIQDIADQTNLLALNAAIEAARAGEQGRGFAVVADEVRALAERTTQATQEIGEMIRAIQQGTRNSVKTMVEGVNEVKIGSGKAEASGEALKSILSQINEVTMQVSQIATAAEEQTATTNEINNNILQISQVIQDTARGAQDSAASAQKLSALSEDLKSKVGKFKI
jgi:methyl-accepting chemotaxis protein